MFSAVSRALAGLVLLGLAGCATTTEIPFDRGANGVIKTIGVLEPAMHPQASVVLASDVGKSFGLVGALVDAGLQENREKTFAAMLAAQNFQPDQTFLLLVKSALSAHGYSTVDIPMDRPKLNLLSGYPAPGQVKVDAYLDVAVTDYGYLAAGIGDSTPYRPFVWLRCRLVRQSDGAVLMEDTINYNPLISPPKIVTLPPNPNYVFTDFDALTADPQKAVKGLNDAFTDAAASIGSLML